MRGISTLLLVIGFGFALPAAADFQAGFTAFQQSDYVTALGEFTPLAAPDPGAAILVGVIYANGYGMEAPDWTEAQRWLEAGAAGGDVPVMVITGAFLGMGRNIDDEFAAATAHFSAAAADADAGSQFLLSWIVTQGLGVAADAEAGRQLLVQAAEGGHGAAQLQLAQRSLDGLGFARDDAVAARWFSRAAEEGLAPAQAALAVLYATGRGIEQDSSEAARWASLAAEQGNAEG